MTVKQQHVSCGEIKDGLRVLGIEAGDRIIVHSSLKSFGYVDGGPETVIRALQETVTANGLLMCPTFNHDRIFLKDGKPLKGAFFDPAESPTVDGIIPETFRRMEGVYRSLNPTHACAAWGQGAEEIVASHHRVLTMGSGSPIALLEQQGGKVVLLGVGYGANTLKHVIEQTFGCPCLGPRTEAHDIKLPDNRIVEGRTWGWREIGCPVAGPAEPIRTLMEAAHYSRSGNIGEARVIVFRMTNCRKVIEDLLTHGWRGRPPCRRCRVRARKMPWTVESDWDVAKNCLKPDSPAHGY
ncbi:AAC(3) family N-acetyltransferase [Planctomycetota bacterium]